MMNPAASAGAYNSANNGSFRQKLGDSLPGIASGVGGLFNWLSASNPADAANPYLEQMQGVAHQYMDPYVNQGNRAGGVLEGQYGNLVNDPTGMLAGWGSQYQQSPGYQWQVDQALGGANRAAAAGGMLGTPMHQQESAQMAQGLANQDYWNWMKNVQGLYGQGLQGEQGMYNTGFQGSQSISDAIQSALASQAQLAYTGAVNEQQQKGGGIGNFLGGIGSVAGTFLGGPAGGMAGNAAGNAIGGWF